MCISRSPSRVGVSSSIGTRREIGRTDTGMVFEQRLQLTHGDEVVQEQVSGYYLVEYGRDAVGRIDDYIDDEEWESWRTMPLAEAAVLLKATAARIDLAMIRKAPRGPKKPVPKRTRFKDKPHVATKRLIDGTVGDGKKSD